MDTPASTMRTDSMLSTSSGTEQVALGVPVQGTASNPTSPLLAGTAGATQVQKGRFSVIDSKASGATGSSAGPLASTTPLDIVLPPSVVPPSGPSQGSETTEVLPQVSVETGVSSKYKCFRKRSYIF